MVAINVIRRDGKVNFIGNVTIRSPPESRDRLDCKTVR
jgi:hypothetical protein